MHAFWILSYSHMWASDGYCYRAYRCHLGMWNISKLDGQARWRFGCWCILYCGPRCRWVRTMPSLCPWATPYIQESRAMSICPALGWEEILLELVSVPTSMHHIIADWGHRTRHIKLGWATNVRTDKRHCSMEGCCYHRPYRNFHPW